jgi:hypothetical protein
MKNKSFAAFAAAGFYATVFALNTPAHAADVTIYKSPAVSETNLRIELATGLSAEKHHDSDLAALASASLATPIDERFGFQFDLLGQHNSGRGFGGAEMQFFARDPSSYLFGITVGGSIEKAAALGFAGPMAEFYKDKFTLEAEGGLLFSHLHGIGNTHGYYVSLDLGYYATDDLRLTAGVKSMAGLESGHLGFEWQLPQDKFDLPLSLTGDVEVNEHKTATATLGVKLYLHNEDNRTLITRHRKDIVKIRNFDASGFLAKARSQKLAAAAKSCPVTAKTCDAHAAAMSTGHATFTASFEAASCVCVIVPPKFNEF